jgi:hypothetical protein
MSLKLRLLQILIPAAVKVTTIKELYEYTAYAFECAPPVPGGQSFVETLRAFGDFFKDEAEKAIEKGSDIGEIKQRLFENARLLGRTLRDRYRIRTLKDAFRMARAFFRILMTDFEGDARGGQIVVRRCFFSSRFSKDVCSIMSSFDEGLLSGLSGGGVLTFIERITDCSACCRARFTLTGVGNPRGG